MYEICVVFCNKNDNVFYLEVKLLSYFERIKKH